MAKRRYKFGDAILQAFMTSEEMRRRENEKAKDREFQEGQTDKQLKHSEKMTDKQLAAQKERDELADKLEREKISTGMYQWAHGANRQGRVDQDNLLLALAGLENDKKRLAMQGAEHKLKMDEYDFQDRARKAVEEFNILLFEASLAGTPGARVKAIKSANEYAMSSPFYDAITQSTAYRGLQNMGARLVQPKKQKGMWDVFMDVFEGRNGRERKDPIQALWYGITEGGAELPQDPWQQELQGVLENMPISNPFFMKDLDYQYRAALQQQKHNLSQE